jgi:hypothetical protein
MLTKKRIYLLLALIIMLGLGLRLLTLRYNSLIEPDNYYYLSILNASHGLSLPAITLDGFPPAEQYGLYLVTLIPHVLTGIGIFTLMLFMAPIYSIITILLVFIFARMLTKRADIALIAALLCAVLPAALNYTLAGSYRGDSFINVFILASAIILYKLQETFQDKHCKYRLCQIALIALLILVLFCAYELWAGGRIAIAIIAVAIVGMLLLSSKVPYAVKAVIVLIAIYLLLTESSLIFIPPPTTIPFISEVLPPTISSISSLFSILAFLSPAPLALSPFLAAFGALVIWFLIGSKFGSDRGATLFSYLLVTLIMTSFYVRCSDLSYIPISIIMAWVIIKLYEKGGLAALIAILSVILLQSAVIAVIYQPANDLAYPSFVNALSWLHSNAPAGSYVLANWQDGSELMAAGFHVYSDSVGAIDDPQHEVYWSLTNSSSLPFTPKPSYLLIRSLEINESPYLCDEKEEPTFTNATQCLIFLNKTYLASHQPNFYRLWYACDAVGCQTDVGSASLYLVFSENDTKIYRILVAGEP